MDHNSDQLNASRMRDKDVGLVCRHAVELPEHRCGDVADRR
jgi:hypothetical protein